MSKYNYDYDDTPPAAFETSRAAGLVGYAQHPCFADDVVHWGIFHGCVRLAECIL